MTVEALRTSNNENDSECVFVEREISKKEALRLADGLGGRLITVEEFMLMLEDEHFRKKAEGEVYHVANTVGFGFSARFGFDKDKKDLLRIRFWEGHDWDTLAQWQRGWVDSTFGKYLTVGYFPDSLQSGGVKVEVNMTDWPSQAIIIKNAAPIADLKRR